MAKKGLTDEELARRLGICPGQDHTPGAGAGLGYVRLEPPRGRPDLVCRRCGRLLGPFAWAEGISNGSGGLFWWAPICDRCKSAAQGTA